MVLPTINFSGVNKVIYSGQEMSKVYCGSELVWEKARYVIAKTRDSLRSGERFLYLHKSDEIRESLRIYKIEIGGEAIIGDFKAESRYDDYNYEQYYRIDLKSNVFSKIIYSGTSVKLYYQ